MIVLLLLAAGVSVAQSKTDLNLVIAIDCSYSVDAREFKLQTLGTANAFLTPSILEAIKSGAHGRISVAVVQWASVQSQVVVVPWTTVANEFDALNLSIAIKNQKRLAADGATSISTALTFAANLLNNSPDFAERQVIDIASDGTNNNGMRVEPVRDQLVAQGITINGLTILNEVSYLNYYFQNRIIGGPGAFVQISNSYLDYAVAIQKKLLREIMGDVSS